MTVYRLSQWELRFKVMDLGEDIDEDGCTYEGGVEGDTEFMLANFIVYLT